MADSTDAAVIVHQVETAYAAYAAAFNDADMETVVRHIAVPYAMIIGGAPPHVADSAEAVRALFDQSLAGMKARGWERSDFHVLRVWPLGPDQALILVDIDRWKAGKALLDTGRYCYTLRRADPNWQITSVFDVAPPFTGPGDFARG
jgi:ketosteroid isomerase-like protein